MILARTTFALIAALALIACGDDEKTPTDTSSPTDTSDATTPSDTSDATTPDDATTPADTADAAPDGDTSEPDPYPIFDLIGSVQAELYTDPDAPEFDATQFDVYVRDGKYANVHTASLSDGDCVHYVRANNVCDPACDETHACDADGSCLAFPKATSIGTVVWQREGSKTITQAPDTTDPSYIYYLTEAADGDWYAPGDAIHVTGSGGDLPAFDVTLQGVAPMTAPAAAVPFEYAASYDADIDFVWTPTNTDSTVELALRTGWHGAPPSSMILCRAPEAQGHILVTKAMLAGFGYCTGACLFQHPSEIQRVSRELVTTPNGPVEVLVKTRGRMMTAAPE